MQEMEYHPQNKLPFEGKNTVQTPLVGKLGYPVA
jgi:hypothetical protein